jgi:hypothetical protein
MQLQQIDGFRLEIAQAALDEGGELGAVVAGSNVRAEASSGLGCDDDLFAALLA